MSSSVFRRWIVVALLVAVGLSQPHVTLGEAIAPVKGGPQHKATSGEPDFLEAALESLILFNILEAVKAGPPSPAVLAAREADEATDAELRALESAWRGVFVEARKPQRLKGFVGETLGLFEKLQQVHDRAVNPAATAERVKDLFRARVLDEDSIVRAMERSLREFSEKLDQQDQAMLLKARIDKAAVRTVVPRDLINSETFKRPIYAAAAAAVNAVESDMSRSVASFVASEAIGMGVKRAARDLGLMPGEEGSFADFLGGLVIEIGVGAAVDAATDPTNEMIRNLELHLSRAEQAILEGTPSSPGFLTTLRRVARERSDARRQIVRAEMSK